MFGSLYASCTQNIKSGHCKKKENKKNSDNQVITLVFLTFDILVF